MLSSYALFKFIVQVDERTARSEHKALGYVFADFPGKTILWKQTNVLSMVCCDFS